MLQNLVTHLKSVKIIFVANGQYFIGCEFVTHKLRGSLFISVQS